MTHGNPAATDALLAMQAALGWRAFRVGGIPWCRYGATTAMTIPLAEVHPVGRSHAEEVLRESGCLLALFPTSARTGVGCMQHMVRDKAYAEGALQRQFRQMLRRGERHLTFHELTWGELAIEGPGALAAYRARQGLRTPVAEGAWRAACEMGAAAADFTLFGCRHGRELAGFEILWRRRAGYDSVCTVVHPGFFKVGAANLLLYRSARALIARSDCHYVNFGRSGVPAIDGHDRFHRHAGLTEEPLHMAAVLHPRLRWLTRVGAPASWLPAARTLLGPDSRVARQLAALGVASATDMSLLPG